MSGLSSLLKLIFDRQSLLILEALQQDTDKINYAPDFTYSSCTQKNHQDVSTNFSNIEAMDAKDSEKQA